MTDAQREQPNTPLSKPYLDHFSPDRAAGIYIRVLKLLQKQRHFRDPDLTARRVAEIIGCDHRAISAALAISTGENFLRLLAKIRANEAARMLRDRRFAEWNVEDIGLHCGFASRQSFYNAFNRVWGITPRQYRLRYHAS